MKTKGGWLLLIPMLCGFGSCQVREDLTQRAAIECSTEAVTSCEGAVVPKTPLLGESEAIDEVNDQRWLACVLRHVAAVKCLHALDKAGYVRFRSGEPQ